MIAHGGDPRAGGAAIREGLADYAATESVFFSATTVPCWLRRIRCRAIWTKRSRS